MFGPTKSENKAVRRTRHMLRRRAMQVGGARRDSRVPNVDQCSDYIKPRESCFCLVGSDDCVFADRN